MPGSSALGDRNQRSTAPRSVAGDHSRRPANARKHLGEPCDDGRCVRPLARFWHRGGHLGGHQRSGALKRSLDKNARYVSRRDTLSHYISCRAHPPSRNYRPLRLRRLRSGRVPRPDCSTCSPVQRWPAESRQWRTEFSFWSSAWRRWKRGRVCNRQVARTSGL